MRCGLVFPVILFLFSLIFQTQAILNGDVANWVRNSYLVKVFARGRRSEIKSCIGALISNQIVITSSACITNDNTKDPLREFAVSMAVRNTSHHEKAILLEKNDNWALLKIHEIDIANLCPEGESEPKQVLRLNLKPNLKASSVMTVTPDEIIGSQCYILGFNTTEQSSTFLVTTNLLRVDVNIKRPREHDVYYRATVSNNFTACFDDVGAPLICETTAHGKMLVGLFQKLGVPITKQESPQLVNRESCSEAREMYFSLLVEDVGLIDFIGKFEISSFIQTYDACGFLHEEEFF